MNTLKQFLLLTGFILLTAGCRKQTFLPDPDDPQLSRFTSRNLQTGTCYINDDIYINYWPKNGMSIGPAGLPYPTLTKVTGLNLPDSIDFSWPIERKTGSSSNPGKFSRMTIRIPVPDDFVSADFKNWNEKRFAPGECTLYLDLERLTGTAGIFFVKTYQTVSDTISTRKYEYFNMSGLFEGQVADSINISKGRFDFVVQTKGF